ncbi:hypothetical protein BKA81DRAFT_382383 [Phyllosticta paracitricarpa]
MATNPPEYGPTTKKIIVDAPNGHSACLTRSMSCCMSFCRIFRLRTAEVCISMVWNSLNQEKWSGRGRRVRVVANDGLIASTARCWPMIPRCGHPRSDSISPSSPPPLPSSTPRVTSRRPASKALLPGQAPGALTSLIPRDLESSAPRNPSSSVEPAVFSQPRDAPLKLRWLGPF